MGANHCPECNTNFVIRDTGIEIKTFKPAERERSRADSRHARTVRHIYKADDVTPNLSLRCNFCTHEINKLVGVRGNIIVGWDQRDVPDPAHKGEWITKNVPKFKEVYSCSSTSCMSQLNQVLPDKMVNPIKDEKNGVVRMVKDVTHDSIKADEQDTTPCDTYVSNEFTRFRSPSIPVGACLYCGRPENAHTVVIKSTKKYAESYNI